MTISFYMWFFLVYGLRKRGQKKRESGAFLIAKNGSTKVTKIVFYDELDPNVFNSGIIDFNGLGHIKLNSILESEKAEVVADIHTHPFGCSTRQSDSDKKHPMSRIKGHTAFIAPNYATDIFLLPRDCSAYKYEGSFQWQTLVDNNFPLKLTII
jgi:hypothetical protein